jgi:hypothetical protein
MTNILRKPLDQSSSLTRAEYVGHKQRLGHVLNAVLWSDNGGETWSRAAFCCGDTVPGPSPRYWVLSVGGYSDTASDYSAHYGALKSIVPPDYGYLDNPAVSVFAGEREPWNEEDPYPDYIVSYGPRSGIRVERA